MTTIEAYDLAIKKVNELKKNGIDFTIRPSKLQNDKKTIKEFNTPERISPERWVHITFKVLNKCQALEIHEAANYLGMCGITFDVGGTTDTRNWEFDWSFRYTGKEDEDRRESRETVEDIISDLADKKK